MTIPQDHTQPRSLSATSESSHFQRRSESDQQARHEYLLKTTPVAVIEPQRAASSHATGMQVSRASPEGLAMDMKRKSKRIGRGRIEMYKLPTELTHSMRQRRGQIAKYNLGYSHSSCPSREFVVMVVGATGSGKTTLINGIANYIFGVERHHHFRFKLITDEGGRSQTHSQTKNITAYTIHKHEGSRFPHTLTIIDTPGFGDTEGLERDRQISADIKQFFSMPSPTGIDQINAVAFVTQASLARLTATQRYIFDSILSIFGKDIGPNIFLMITFADGAKPAVLKAVKEAEIPFQRSFKFNNSALFMNEDDDDSSEDVDEGFCSMFWNMGEKSFKTFLRELVTMEPRSLLLTREVLDERERLKVIMQAVQQNMHNILSKIDELEQEQHVLEQHQADVEANRNFTYTVEEPMVRQIDISGQGIHVTNCLKCNFTCHENCAYADDKDKIMCIAMMNGSCTVCTGKCRWDLHKNNPFRFEFSTKRVTRTYDNLKKRYESAAAANTQKTALVTRLKAEVERRYQDALDKICKAQQILKRLDEIALRPNPLSEVEYIDLLIQSEEDQAKSGYKKRIQCLQKVRKEAELLSKMKDKTIYNERALNQAAQLSAAMKH